MPSLENSRFDPSLEALTPEGVKFVLFPAGLPVRTVAYAIDKITQWLILLVILIPGAVVNFSTGVWIILILDFCVEWFYHVICELAFRGQSFGKRVMGIRVVKSSGSPVDPGASFLRNLLRFADTFFSLFPIALIAISASRGFRRLGDWAGGTVVVYSKTAMRIPQDITDFLTRFDAVSPPRPLSHEEKQAILSFARRYPLLGESRANEIAGIYAPCLKNNGSGLSDSECLMGIARFLLGAASLPGESK